MRWALDSEQDMFRDAFSDWLERWAKPDAVRGWNENDPAPFEEQLAAEGWLAVGTPESHGGQGGGLLELALAAEQLARRAAPSSAWLASVLALPALDAASATAVVEEGRMAALVVSADGLPDSAAPLIEVENALLTGTVTPVLGAERAQLLVVPTPDGLYLVEAAAEGVTITPRLLLDRSRGTATVALAKVAGQKLDADVDAFLKQAALRAAVLIAADSLGAASRMLELAVEYSKQRTQFGSQIGSFQAMKHAAAMMLVDEEAARSIVYYAATSVEEGAVDCDLHAAAAKAQATAGASHSAESALTMHGAIGYTWEHDLQLLYKRTKLNVALFGDAETWNERIAERLELIVR
jgi:alkylation response protein AidB-like acyl-CoA dehydrogenase